MGGPDSDAIGRVRLSVRSFPLYLLNELIFDPSFCTCMCHDHSSPGIESQGYRSRSMQKCVCYASIYCGVLRGLTDGRNSRFYCHIISCALARRGVRRGAVDASDSGGVLREWAS